MSSNANQTQGPLAKPAPARPVAEKRGRGRIGKAALGRAKLAAVAISVVAFVGTLAGISQTNPQTAAARAAGQNSQPAPVIQEARVPLRSGSLIAPSSPSTVVLPPLPQAPNITFRPYARTRGS